MKGQPVHRAITLLEFIVVIILLGILVGLLLPAVNACRMPHRYWTQNHAHMMLRALQSYCADHNAMPPRVTYDDAGKPMHSWRALLLPYFDVRGYRMDQRWNSPHNLRVAEDALQFFDYEEPGNTAILAVYGPDTFWDPAHQDLAKRLILTGDDAVPLMTCVVSEDHQVGWCEPADFSVDRMDELLVRPYKSNDLDWRDGFFAKQYYGRTFLASYWSGGRLDLQDADLFRRIACASTCVEARAEYRKLRRLESASPVPRLDYVTIRYDNILRLAVFVGIALYPLRWRSPRREDRIS